MHFESTGFRKRTDQPRRNLGNLWRRRALPAILLLSPTLLLSGCAGLVSAGGTKSQSGQEVAIQVTPGNFNFGNLVVGKKISQTATVSNTGNTSINVTAASVSSGQFAVSGISMPLSLPVGQSSAFQVWFDPSAAGTVNGTLTIQTDNGVSSGQVTLSGVATTPPQQISLSSTALSLGSATIGTTLNGSLTLTNTGGANLIISLISVNGGPFGVSGITTPSTIVPGGNATMNVSFTPTTAGSDSGSITITSNDPNSPTATVALAGTGTSSAAAPTITTQPVNQTVTAGQTATFTAVAGGTAPLSYQWQKNGANIAGATATSYTTPATATTDSGSTFRVVVNNTAGTVTSAAATLTVNAAPVAPTITTQPVNQTVTAGQTATFTVVAGGTAPLSYQWQKNGANIAGATATSYTTPATATTDSGSTFAVVVSNTAGTVTSNSATLTVNAAPVPGIQVSLSSVNFGSVADGSSSSQTLTITNTGTATLSITQVTVTGSVFSASGFSFPWNVNAGKQTTITVAFLPTSIGAMSGNISLVSNAPTSPTSVGLTGTGIAATFTLGISPASLSFGNVTTNTSSATQNVTITNTGNSNVTISQITLNGSSYFMTGGTAPVTLSPLQNLTLTIQFSPTAAGSLPGSISIVSNASGSPATISLTGTGVAPVQHSVDLSWTASTSAVSGYNVYRGTVSGGPYTKINSSLITTLTYTDTTVQSGTTYYYVATAVDSNGDESVNSNEASASIP
jgi:hypothetical protein